MSVVLVIIFYDYFALAVHKVDISIFIKKLIKSQVGSSGQKTAPFRRRERLLFAHAPGGVCIERSSFCRRPEEEGGFRRWLNCKLDQFVPVAFLSCQFGGGVLSSGLNQSSLIAFYNSFSGLSMHEFARFTFKDPLIRTLLPIYS